MNTVYKTDHLNGLYLSPVCGSGEGPWLAYVNLPVLGFTAKALKQLNLQQNMHAYD